jgi:PBP1b-binding outer membrane lipoprotein LpoB
MKKIIVLAAAVGASLFLVGCQTTEPVVKKTSLEIQAVQARMFETDKTTAFRSVVSVLQDLGYVVQTASMETGLVTAQSPTQQDTSGAAAFAAVFGGVRTEGRTVVTATVEDFNAKQTRVRLNFVDKRFRSSAYGQQASDEKPIDDPKIYENAFEKISEAIFIRQAQR